MQSIGERDPLSAGSGQGFWLTRSLRRMGRSFMRHDYPFRSHDRLAETLLAAPFIAGMTLYGAFLSGDLSSATHHITASLSRPFFPLQEVQITGQIQTYEQDVLDYLGVTEQTSLFGFSAEKARERVKALPWVRDASVQKLFPNALSVMVREHKPFALWQYQGRSFVINASGETIASPVPDDLRALPHFFGKGANSKAQEFRTALLMTPALMPHIGVAEYVEERRWTLHLYNGIKVLLPEEDMGRALQKLARLDTRYDLLSRDLERIDMRQPDRLVMRLPYDVSTFREKQKQQRDLLHIRAGGV
jgi:cell division protein FtsQ